MRLHIILLVAAAGLLGACDRTPEAGAETHAQSTQLAVAEAGEADVVVYKSPTCGCCNGWVEHLRAAGYEVETVDLEQYAALQARKQAEGVPGHLGSCHTAVVDGYTIEGHVPAEAIERLLSERPDIKGLAVPGMPIGSPGMEGPNPQPYRVIAFTQDGQETVFEVVDPRR